MFLRSLAVLLSSLVFSAGASGASTIEFSISSSEVDLGTVSAGEASYILQGHVGRSFGERMHGLKGQLVFDADCSQNKCINRSYNIFVGATWTPMNEIFTLKSMSGFTDGTVFGLISFDGFGNIAEWTLTSTEYGAIGDFRLSNTGDSYAVGPLNQMGYCLAVYGFDPNSPSGCPANAVASLIEFDLGTSAWERSAPIVSQIPVPASSLLLLTGLGGLFVIRRRRAR